MDDESWRVMVKEAGEDGGDVISPEYHYWSWLNYCHLKDCDPDGDIIGGDIKRIFPLSVRKGGPWE